MKKYLKISIIVLLVLAVIGGTCYVFFKQYDDKKKTTDSFVNFLMSNVSVAFNDNLNTINGLVKEGDSTDERFDLIITTKTQLEKVLYDLSAYHISSGTKIKDEDIANSLNVVKAQQSLLMSMMNEYKIKSSSTYFKRHLGANDLYKQSCAYLVNYANLVNKVNQSVDVNKNADVKFDLYDVYSNVVMITFEKLNSVDSTKEKVVVENTNNIDLINNKMTINNMSIETAIEPFSIEINNFNKYYNNCDKLDFAKNLSTNVESVNSENQQTNEKIATYYFKLIMGL